MKRSIALGAFVAGVCLAGTAAAETLRFDISRFELTGDTELVPAPELQAAVQPYTGPAREFADVQAALDALQALFQARGLGTVRIDLPEQALDQGVVRLRVVAQRIGRVTVEGAVRSREDQVRRSVPGLREGEVPNLREVSASLRQANENPARKLSLHLQGGSADDGIDATLRVADENPWKLGATLDNSGSAASGRTHVSLSVQHADLWGLDHVGSLQYTTSLEHPRQVSVYGAGYRVPLPALGDALDFFASYSDVDSGTVSAGAFDLAISGKGRTLGMRWQHPLARDGAWDARLSAGLDRKAYVNGIGWQGFQLGQDVTVRPLSLAFAATRSEDGQEWSLDAALLRNLPGGANGGTADLQQARSGANPRFTLLRASASLVGGLPDGWQWRAAVNGQYTRDALIPGEQFGAGGQASVRGFAERALANDHGAQFNAELYSPGLCTGEGAPSCRLLWFYDAAYAARNHALAGEPTHAAIGATGLGWRLQWGRDISAQLDWGRVTAAGGLPESQRQRLHLRLSLAH